MSSITVLVTGGAGFIGSHITDRLIAEGYRVVVVDNLSTGRLENINQKALFYRVDLRNPSDVEEIFAKEKPEIVNHHAAQVDVTQSVSDPANDAHINIIGGINVLNSACKHGVRRFIYASTAAVYGEPEYVPLDENHPIKPLSAYGLSKHTFERYLELEASRTGMECVILRYANVFGPRQVPHGEGGVVAVFATRMLAGEPCRIFGSGDKTRDYVFVKDVVEANILAMQSKTCGVFNIGTGK
ncbi:MAG: SDR family NAD(P)-dependent oxidoreductase, partial [Armatimonadota bacterium]|nr:SDR family NAD(P)-dependent oxidoreductase [Armatimonadota bacterium]